MKNLSASLKQFLFAAVLSLLATGPALAAGGNHLDADVNAALQALYADSPTAKALGDKAKAILVFPNVTKAGFVIGAQGGDGALLKNGRTAGYYNTAAVSVGLQAGAQTFGYAMFFMSNAVLRDFEKSKNWQIGVGPTVVVVDSGMAKDVSTLTTKADIYAMIFDQKGLMAGVGLQGSKITKLGR
jgi:lipid-binding SYLF domain-containing protein